MGVERGAVPAARRLSLSTLAFVRFPSGDLPNSPLPCLGRGLVRLS